MVIRQRGPGWFPLAAGLLAASVVGCQFHTDIPAGQVIRCDADAGAACPDGYVCRPSVNRCIPLSDVNHAVVAVTGHELSPPIGNTETVFTLSFGVTQPLAQTPSAFATSRVDSSRTFPFTCHDCAPGQTCTCTFQASPGNLPPDGILDVGLSLVDLYGGAPVLPMGNIVFDRTVPNLLQAPTLTLTKAPGITTPISALTFGSGAQVCFAVDKPIQSCRVWAGLPDAGELTFDGGLSGAGGCFSFTLYPDAGVDDGVRTLYAEVTDLAGNAVELVLVDGGLVVDTTPPPPPDLSEATGLRYRWAPWGEWNGTTIGDPLYQLSSPDAGSAITERGWLVVYGRSFGTGQLATIAQTHVARGPLPPLGLQPLDRPDVFVDLVDEAGNRASPAPLQVRNLDWVATMVGSGPSGSGANPNTCLGRTVARTGLEVPGEASGLEANAPTGSAIWISGSASWRQRQLYPVAFDTYAVDTYRGTVLGYSPQGSSGGLYEFDGVDWFNLAGTTSTDLSQAASGGLALAYDAARDRLVAFSCVSSVAGCSTFTWDRTGWSPPITTPIAPRTRALMTYDPLRGQVVLMGGKSMATTDYYSDIWGWDGTQWNALGTMGNLAGQNHSALTHQLLPDGGGRLVLFGPGLRPSDGGAPIATNATWAGLATDAGYAWSPITSAAGCSGAPSCNRAQLAADSRTGALMLATREALPDAGAMVQLWASGGSSNGWTALPTALPLLPTSPGSCGLFSLAADPAVPSGDAGFLLALGCNGRSVAGNAPGWTELCSAQGLCTPVEEGPTNVGNPYSTNGYSPSFALAPSGRGIVTYQRPGNSANYEFDGLRFYPSALPMGDAGIGGVVYQPVRNEFWSVASYVGAGGTVFELWTGTPDAGWVDRGPISVAGGLAADAGLNNPFQLLPMTGAGVDDGVVAVSNLGAFGIRLDATNTIVAQQLSTNKPPLFPLAYDSARNRGVAINGGSRRAYETGPTFTWVDAGALATPSLSTNVTAYDPLLASTLSLADSSGTYRVIRWDGTQATLLPEAPGAVDPTWGWMTVTAYQAPNEASMFLGTNGLWELGVSRNRPAEVCRFDLASTHAPPEAAITRLRLEAAAAAKLPSGSPADVELDLWRGGWQPVLACPASRCTTDLPRDLAYESVDPALLSVIDRDSNSVGVQLVPAARNGAGYSQVGVRCVQLLVSYRLQP